MIWIRTYRILIFLITAFLMSGNTWSQNVLHRNNYFIQEYLINPAFTGGKDFNPFYMSYRNQFSQLQERVAARRQLNGSQALARHQYID